MALVLLISLMGGWKLAAAAEEQGELEGLPIVRIVFERSNIFDTSDPATSSWFYRAANSLHIVSKEGFLRQMLLFEEGDTFSVHEAEESARILRSLGFLNPVTITGRSVEGGVEVTVATRDRWTLIVGLNFDLFGNRKDIRVLFEELNFLGWGKSVKFQYRSDVERDTWRYEYIDPNVAGTRVRTEVTYEDSTDGFRRRLLLGRPFYSLATARAWHGVWDSEESTEHLYSESESAVDGLQISDRGGAWYGLRLPTRGETTHRLKLGYDYRRDQFRDWVRNDGAPYPTPVDREISGPRIEYEQIRDRFVVVYGYRAWSVQEDVAMGPNFSLGATLSAPELGGDRRRLLLDGGLTTSRRFGGWVASGSAWFRGRLEDGGPRDWLVGGQATAAQLGPRGWQFRLLIEGSHELDLDRQLTLGGDVGLRGWDPDFFDGTGRALANVQWRTLVKEDLFHIMTLGVQLFTDVGMTWDPRVGRDTDGVRADVGIGLLADLTALGRSSLLRLEVALPDDGSGYTVIVATHALF